MSLPKQIVVGETYFGHAPHWRSSLSLETCDQLRLGRRFDSTYEIHGTNNPVAVGLAVTHGCIRMYPEDVAALFAAVSVGTKVWLINEPVKIAYVDGKLLLEVHPPVDGEGQTAAVDVNALSQKLRTAFGQDTAAIHWDFTRKALEAATGVPTVVGLRAHLEEISSGTDIRRAPLDTF